MWATSWENLLMLFANNKDADQPAHPCSLISVFVFRSLDSIWPVVSISEISSLLLVSVSEQAGLSQVFSWRGSRVLFEKVIHILRCTSLCVCSRTYKNSTCPAVVWRNIVQLFSSKNAISISMSWSIHSQSLLTRATFRSCYALTPFGSAVVHILSSQKRITIFVMRSRKVSAIRLFWLVARKYLSYCYHTGFRRLAGSYVSYDRWICVEAFQSG